MPHSPSTSPAPIQAGSALSSHSAALTLPQLAHELNSLLDGSMRSLGLAETALDGELSKATADSVLARMRLAHSGLREMAQLLERTMRQGAADVRLFESDQPLAAQVHKIIDSLQSLAHHHRVDMAVHISPAAGRVRASTLGAVILNAMRNAIEACASVRRVPRRVEFSATLTARNELVMLISDNGPGLPATIVPGQSAKSHGHGIGLTLCRQITEQLGGRFEIVSVPNNQGAVVRVVIPEPGLAAA